MKSCNFIFNNKFIAIFASVAAVAWVPAAQASAIKDKLVSMSFFEAGFSTPPMSARKYAKTFKNKSTRYIFTQVKFRSGIRKEHKVSIRAEYYRPNGSYMGGPEKAFALSPGKNTFFLGWGWRSPGNWQPGSYKVKIYYNKLLVGEQVFEVKPGGQPPAPIAATTTTPATNTPVTAKTGTTTAAKTQTPESTNTSKKTEMAREENVRTARTENYYQPDHSHHNKHGHNDQNENYNDLHGKKRPNLLDPDQVVAKQMNTDIRPKKTSNSFPTPKLIGKAPGRVSIWEVENKTPYSLQIRYSRLGVTNTINIAAYSVQSVYLSGGNYKIHGILSKQSIPAFDRTYYFSIGNKYLTSFIIRNRAPGMNANKTFKQAHGRNDNDQYRDNHRHHRHSHQGDSHGHDGQGFSGY